MIKLQCCILLLGVFLVRALAAPTEPVLADEDAVEGATGEPPEVARYQQLLIAEYRSSCIAMSGSDEGYLKTVAAFSPAMSCVAGTEGLAQFVIDFKDNFANEEARQRVMERYRPVMNRSLECFNDVIDGAAMCSGDDFDTMKMIYSKMISNFLELMCSNGGKIILDFQTEEVKSCVSHIMNHAESCKLYDNVFKKPVSQYGEEECSALEQSKKCLKDLADTCDGGSIMSVFNVTYEPIELAANCTKNDVVAALGQNVI